MSDKLEACFDIGARVEKKSGSSWRGIIVGSYSTDLTPIGWAVESETEKGSVQIYPEKALRPATRPAERDAEGWLPIESAPYSKIVQIRVGRMIFEASLERDASMTEDEQSCDQWHAAHEGEHPPCWSGGACWSSNEDEAMSLQPEAWRPLPTSAQDSAEEPQP